MTRLPVHSVDSAPEASRDALKALEARVGKVLTIYGGMAHSPAVLSTPASMPPRGKRSRWPSVR